MNPNNLKQEDFNREAEKLEGWILEKLQVVLSDEGFKDVSNLQAKIRRHQDFEREVLSNRNALDFLIQMGSEMTDLADFEPNRKRIEELRKQWNRLLQRIARNGSRYERALQLDQYIQSVDEVLLCIREKNQEPERVDHQELAELEDELKFLRQQVESLARLEGENLDELINMLCQDLCELQERLNHCPKVKRDEVITVFNRDAERLKTWIFAKIQAALSDEGFKYISNLQAKIRMHQDFQLEVSAHESEIVRLEEMSRELTGYYASESIRKIEELRKLWNLLQERLGENELRYQQALRLDQYIQSVDEIQLCIRRWKRTAEDSDHDDLAELEGNLKALRREAECLVRSDAEDLDEVIDEMCREFFEVQEMIGSVANEGSDTGTSTSTDTTGRTHKKTKKKWHNKKIWKKVLAAILRIVRLLSVGF